MIFLREYLLGLTRSREFLVSILDYPRQIGLSQGWHDTLDQIRKDSVDGIERLALVGFKEDRRAIYLPTIGVKGLPDHVPSAIISREIQRARVKAGITGLIGDIHSHPRSLIESIWGNTSDQQNTAGFSAGDLYRMVSPGEFLPMMVVVEGNGNIVAFKTKESTDTGLDRNVLTQEGFEKYWYEKNGFRYLGRVEKYGAERAVPISPNANGWNVNLGIAERHKLVLYRGGAGNNLVKLFPMR